MIVLGKSKFRSIIYLKWWSATEYSRSFIRLDTMIQVASSFSTDPSLDVVLASIPAQISEAIHFLKENMDTFTAKVSLILSHPLNPPGHFLYLKKAYFMYIFST